MTLALSIRQPWCFAILHGGKDIENRDWPTKVRGRVLIHASKKHDGGDAAADINDLMEETGFSDAKIDRLVKAHPLEFGGIVGEVENIGPAITREDYHCEHLTRPEWVTVMTSRQLSGTGGGATGIPDLTDNAFGFNGTRGDCAFGSNRGVVPWRADSIISAGADYRLPHTKWIFAFGATDTTTIVVPMARLLQDEIAAYNGGATCASGNNSVCYEHTAAATPHQIYSTANGTALIRTDLLVDCVNR
jgi:hypothetical protein